MSRLTGFLATTAVIGLIGVALMAQKPAISTPREAEPDNPLAMAQFRYQGRLDPDGTVPENHLQRALDAKKRLARRGPLSPTNWTYLGPKNFGGRIRAILVHPTDSNIMWVGSCGGGIWKTTDGGARWDPMDDFLPGMAIGCMVLDPTNPNVLYAGTGEGFFETEEGSTNTACIRGAGIFKSVDGGVTWTQQTSTANPDFYFVNRLAVSPTDHNVLLAATSTGIYRTTDGGASWTRTLTGEWAYDVDFHPTDPNRAIAGVHVNGVYYTTDGGLSWNHSPSVAAHRSELAYAASNPQIVYDAAAEGDQIKIWRSSDGGATFTQQGAAPIGNYSAYNVALWVNPTDPASLIYGGIDLARSTNSGTTSSGALGSVHSDMHIIVPMPGFNGTSNRTILIGCDGGLYKVPDFSGSATSFYTGIGITQFYGSAINPISGRIMGGTQDNYTLLYSGDPSNWTVTAGGDGGYNQTDPGDQNYFYGCIYWALQFRSTDGGVNADYCYGGPNPIIDAGDSANCNFINPFTLDPNNANRMLVGTIRLWRSNNVKAGTPDWFEIKPPLSGDKSGGDNAHFAPNNPLNISAVTVAKGNSDVIWVGHNNGKLFKTINGTAPNPTWVRMDTNGPLPSRWISKVAIDPANPNHVYVSFLGWHDDSVWETTNGGTTWTDIASGKLIPASVNVIALHPTVPGWIFAGTDLGLFTTTDNGKTWSTTTQGPGTVSVEEITFKDPSTLVIATYGRGMWMGSITSSGVPHITSLSPSSGIAGGPAMTLTVNGTDFSAASVVKWSGASRPTTYISPTEIRAEIGASDLAFAQTVSVQVVTPPPGGGSSNFVNFPINNPKPVLAAISPDSKVEGGPNFVLTVTGSGFVNSSRVLFNGVLRSTIFVSSTKLTSTITSSDIATVGTYPVWVRNPAPGGGDSATKTFTVTKLGPSSIVVSPSALTGGQSANGAVYLNGPAPAGGLTISLTRSGSAVQVPPTTVAPAGKYSGLFTLTTTPVAVDTLCSVTASANSVTRSTIVKVLSPQPNLVTLNPSSITAGQGSTGTFALSGRAPAGGIQVKIASGVPSIVIVPATVFVPAGQFQGSFSIKTKPYGQEADIAVWAIFQKRGAYAMLHLSP